VANRRTYRCAAVPLCRVRPGALVAPWWRELPVRASGRIQGQKGQVTPRRQHLTARLALVPTECT